MPIPVAFKKQYASSPWSSNGCWSCGSAGDTRPSRSSGRVPIIDPNKRRKQQRVLSPAEKQRFKIRSTVERSNSHLKDCLISTKIMVRGPEKVSHCLMTGVQCLAAIKILQYCILPDLQETA